MNKSKVQALVTNELRPFMNTFVKKQTDIVKLHPRYHRMPALEKRRMAVFGRLMCECIYLMFPKDAVPATKKKPRVQR